MKTHHPFRALLLSAPFLLTTTSSLAANIPLLNHNFESDHIPANPGHTTRISGWVSSGTGTIGVYAPESLKFKDRYHSVGNRGQVNFIDIGGRMSQTTTASLLANETYTLSFDTGKWGEHDLQFVARLKANGLVIAQLSSSEMDLIDKEWTNNTLSFTATQDMPIGAPIVIEFANLQTQPAQINLDNITFSTAGTATTLPGKQLGALTLITQDATLLVPDQFPNINMALRYLDDKQIKVGKTVTIQVTDCGHQVYTESVAVAHPNGYAIHIIGNVESPESCVLQFENVHGFVAQNGNRIGLIDGFKLNGNAIEERTVTGVLAQNHAYIKLGSGIIVESFYHGVFATLHSTIAAQETQSNNNIKHGYVATSSSLIQAQRSQANSNEYGYVAEITSTIIANQADASNNRDTGFYSAKLSHIEANHSSSNNNGNTGYVSWSFSSTVGFEATARNNQQAGFKAQDMGYIYSYKAVSQGNDSNYSPLQRQVGNNNSYMQTY